MWSNLPDELIQNVLTYWSPRIAHKIHQDKVYDFLENLDTHIYHIIDNGLVSRVSREELQYYINIYNKMLSIEKVNMTDKSLIIKDNGKYKRIKLVFKNQLNCQMPDYDKRLNYNLKLIQTIIDEVLTPFHYELRGRLFPYYDMGY